MPGRAGCVGGRAIEAALRRVITAGDLSVGTLAEVCRCCVEGLAVTAVSVSLRTAANPEGGSVASGPLAELMTELQLVLGQGPAVEAYGRGRPVLVADLDEAVSRWPEFTSTALEAGVRAVFAFPLQVGVVLLGVLCLFRDQAGALGDPGFADAMVAGDLVTELVLAMQAQAPPGPLAGALDALFEPRVVVHQATGRISAQLKVGVDEALVRLRAFAFALDQPLEDLARQVVDGTVRFDGQDEPRSTEV